MFQDFFQVVYIRAKALRRLKAEFAPELLAPRLATSALRPATDVAQIFICLLVMFADSNLLALKNSLTSAKQAKVCKRLVEVQAFFQRFVKLTDTRNKQRGRQKGHPKA